MVPPLSRYHLCGLGLRTTEITSFRIVLSQFVDFACVLTGNFRAKKRSSSLTNSAVITKEGTDHRTYTTMMGNSVPVFRVRQTKLSYFSLLDFECHAANMKRDRHLVRLY